MPRSVPRRWFRARLHCARLVSSPWRANSLAAQTTAKTPRSSEIVVASIIHAPARRDSVNVNAGSSAAPGSTPSAHLSRGTPTALYCSNDANDRSKRSNQPRVAIPHPSVEGLEPEDGIAFHALQYVSRIHDQREPVHHARVVEHPVVGDDHGAVDAVVRVILG